MWLCSDSVLHNLTSVQICHSTTNCNFKPHHIQNLTAFHSLTLCKSAEILFSIATAFSTAVASHAYYRQMSVHFQDANSMKSETVLHRVTFIGAMNIQNVLVTHSAADKELRCQGQIILSSSCLWHSCKLGNFWKIQCIIKLQFYRDWQVTHLPHTATYKQTVENVSKNLPLKTT
jgi:hypothetical protein